MEFKPKAKSTARPIPIPRRAEPPTTLPPPPARALLTQGLQRLISTPVQSQRQAAHPVLQAAGLGYQAEQRGMRQRQALAHPSEHRVEVSAALPKAGCDLLEQTD